MEFITFVRKPFTVEAVEVTEDNIAEIAEMIGNLRHKENGTPYIAVNRRLVPNLFRVYVGFWLTKMGDTDNIRCYSKRVFNQQFLETNAEIDNWISYLNNKDEEDIVAELTTPIVDDVSQKVDAETFTIQSGAVVDVYDPVD